MHGNRGLRPQCLPLSTVGSRRRIPRYPEPREKQSAPEAGRLEQAPPRPRYLVEVAFLRGPAEHYSGHPIHCHCVSSPGIGGVAAGHQRRAPVPCLGQHLLFLQRAANDQSVG